MRKFRGQIVVEFEISVDESVIKRCLEDAEWRKDFYQFNTPEEVAGNLAYNFVRNTQHLSNLDGFADLDDDLVKLTKERWTDDDVEAVDKIGRKGKRYDKVGQAKRRKKAKGS